MKPDYMKKNVGKYDRALRLVRCLPRQSKSSLKQLL